MREKLAALFIAVCAAALLGSPRAGSAYPARSAPEATVAEALSGHGAELADIGLDPLELAHFGGDRFRTWEFDFLSRRPAAFPAHSRQLAASLTEAGEQLSAAELMQFVHARQQRDVRLGLIDDELTPYREQLDGADDSLGLTLEQLNAEPASKPQLRVWSEYPEEVRRALLVFMLAVDEAWDYREVALGKLEPRRLAELARRAITEDESRELSPAEEVELEHAYSALDFRMTNTGATLIALAVDNLESTLAEHSAELTGLPGVALTTPYGFVVLEGAGEVTGPGGTGYDTGWPPSPGHLTLLRVLLPEPGEPAEDEQRTHTRSTFDRLQGGREDRKFTSSPERNFAFVHIALDDRNDTYTGGYGSLATGVSILIDRGGDDTWDARESFAGPSGGVFGTAVVLDRSGDDLWQGDRLAQGAGLFGFGAAADLAGDDRYQAFQYSQGFGYVGGAGVLYDREGSDRYTARDDEVRYPSPQSEEHNANLSQGFGYGKRADYTNGHSLAGGVGVLIDGGGDDTYSAGVFAQGGGYWYGTGMLHDSSGDDEYSGQWYVQGAGAHFAFGGLYDGSGSDRYTAPMNMAQGAGHDLSAGVLWEAGGDDRYTAPSLALGASNARGVGLFVDTAGDDRYSADGRANFGAVSAWDRGGARNYFRAVGVFLDLAGDDRYPEAEELAYTSNSTVWTGAGREPERGEIALGVDR